MWFATSYEREYLLYKIISTHTRIEHTGANPKLKLQVFRFLKIFFFFVAIRCFENSIYHLRSKKSPSHLSIYLSIPASTGTRMNRRKQQLKLDFDTCFGNFFRGEMILASDVEEERSKLLIKVDLSSGSVGTQDDTLASGNDSPNHAATKGGELDSNVSSGNSTMRCSGMATEDLSPTSFSRDPRVAADAAAAIAARIAEAEPSGNGNGNSGGGSGSGNGEKGMKLTTSGSDIAAAAAAAAGAIAFRSLGGPAVKECQQAVSQTLGAAMFSMGSAPMLLESFKGDLGAALADAGYLPAAGGGGGGGGGGGWMMNSSSLGGGGGGGGGGRRGKKITVFCRRDVGGPSMEAFFSLLQIPDRGFEPTTVNLGSSASEAINSMLARIRGLHAQRLEEVHITLFDPDRFELAIAENDGRLDTETGFQRFRGKEPLNESWTQHLVMVPRTDIVTAPFVPRHAIPADDFANAGGAPPYLRFTVQIPNIGGSSAGGSSFASAAAGAAPSTSSASSSPATVPGALATFTFPGIASSSYSNQSSSNNNNNNINNDPNVVLRSIDIPCDLPMNFLPEFLCTRLFFRNRHPALVAALESAVAFDMSSCAGSGGQQQQAPQQGQGALSSALVAAQVRSALSSSVFMNTFRLDNGATQHGDVVAYMTVLMLWRWGVRRLVVNMTKDQLAKLLRAADGDAGVAGVHGATSGQHIVEMDDAQASAFRTYLVTKINKSGERQERQFDVHGAFIYNHLPNTEFGTKNPRRAIADISSLRICSDSPVRAIIEYGGAQWDPNVGMTLAVPHTISSEVGSGGGEREGRDILEFLTPEECKAFVSQVSVLRNIQRLVRLRSMSFASSGSGNAARNSMMADPRTSDNAPSQAPKTGFFSKMFS